MFIDLDDLSNARIKKQIEVFILMSDCKLEKQYAREILTEFKKTKDRNTLKYKLEVLSQYVEQQSA